LGDLLRCLITFFHANNEHDNARREKRNGDVNECIQSVEANDSKADGNGDKYNC
jgi:hypothetical protein